MKSERINRMIAKEVNDINEMLRLITNRIEHLHDLITMNDDRQQTLPGMEENPEKQ